MDNSQELPEVSNTIIDGIFKALIQMEVELDNDPLQFGPKRLNQKVAETRRLLTDCENIFLKVSLWLQKYRSSYRTLEVELDIEKKHLFANDPEVRAGRNVADREALATMRLRDQVRKLSDVAQTQNDLEALLTVIKAKRADLKDIQGRLKDQIKLCQEEIGLGSKWGAKLHPDERMDVDIAKAPPVNKQTLKDLHEMFRGSGVPELDAHLVVETPSPVEAAPVEAAPVDATQGTVGGDTLSSGDFFESDDQADDFLSAISAPVQERRRTLEDVLGDLDL